MEVSNKLIPQYSFDESCFVLFDRVRLLCEETLKGAETAHILLGEYFAIQDEAGSH